MFNYSKKHFADMPDITVYMNCDTRLAINLGVFGLGEYDEFIFAIKNYNYIDSASVFLFRATKDDLDDKGEVVFKITPEASKNLKPGAFYNFAIRVNAFNDEEETEYKKITGNGKVLIEYGAQDLEVSPEDSTIANEIIGIRLELINNKDEEA